MEKFYKLMKVVFICVTTIFVILLAVNQIIIIDERLGQEKIVYIEQSSDNIQKSTIEWDYSATMNLDKIASALDNIARAIRTLN